LEFLQATRLGVNRQRIEAAKMKVEKMKLKIEQEDIAPPVVFKITVTDEADGCRAELSREKPDSKLLAVVGNHATQQAAFVALLQHCIETGEGV
jgi:hypothetical protein